MSEMQKIEPLLQPDENRYVMFPIQYNDIWDMYKRSIDSFWHTGEISLAQDLNDWNTLNSDEQNFIKMVLAFFSNVGFGWAGGWRLRGRCITTPSFLS